MCCLLNLGSTNRTGTIFIRHVLDSQMSSFFCCGEGKWTEGIVKGLCSTSTIILIMQKYWPVLMQQLYCLGLYLVITTLRCRPTHYFSTPSSTRSTSIKLWCCRGLLRSIGSTDLRPLHSKRIMGRSRCDLSKELDHSNFFLNGSIINACRPARNRFSAKPDLEWANMPL